MQLKRISICVALAIAPNAFAAEPAVLDEVVVTAPAMEGPLTVTTDPRKPRQPVPAHDGADYLKTVPGFSVIRKGGTDGDPMLRGMAGSRLNILLDGEQILGGCGQRMDPPTAYVFPAAYDKITVLKGPQTVLHGPGNSAGTVLFERTTRHQPGVQVDASAMLGSFGRNDEMVEVRGGGEQAYARAAYTRSSAQDYRDGSAQSVHSAYTRWSGNVALGYAADGNTRIELAGAQSDGKAAYADRAMDGVKFARDNVGIKFDRKHMGGTLDSIEAQVYYNYVDHVMDNYSLRTFRPIPMMMPNPSVSNPDRATTGGRVAAGLAMGEATNGKVGIDFQGNKHTVRTTMNQTTMPYEAMARVQDAQFGNLGVFGELTHAYTASSRVAGGLRVDNWQAEDLRSSIKFMSMMAAQANTPSTRSQALTSGFLRYETDYDASTAYLGLGHTERAPDYWELFSNESLTTLSAFNTRPEKTTQLDAGWLYNGESVSGSVSAFYGKVTDYILVQSGVAKAMHMPTGATVTRNVNATTWGFEANAATKLAQHWKLDGSLAYVHGTNDTDGLALAQLPPLEARLGAGYDDGVWSGGALLRMVAAQDRFAARQGNIVGQDIGRTAGFGVFSLNGAYRAGKDVLLSAGVDNLFNKTYAEHVSRAGFAVTGFTTTTRINEIGRNLWVKANLKF